MLRPLDDRLLRGIGIPAFGLSIPHLTGLFGSHTPHEAIYWFGVTWFVALSWLIWHANLWLLLKQRQHVDWFGEPLQKILLLLVGVVFGTVPVTLAMLVAWYRLAGFAAVDWPAVELVTLTNTICVVFVTHVYETVFLIKERESDLVRVERAERARALAELEALRAQLDPHFLFNSLNTLGSLIEDEPARARDFNERLARVYRYILSSRGRSLVFLSEEMEFVDDYLALLAVRFGDALHVTTNRGEPLLEQQMVPPIALQVLLENAVKHNELSLASPLEVKVVVEPGRVSVSNVRRPRRDAPASARVGLQNLAERYRVVAQASIEVVERAETFAVHLPLLPT